MGAPLNNAEVHSSFAGALAAFAADTASSTLDEASLTAGNPDGLADDVASFSYEHVLRTHPRHTALSPFTAVDNPVATTSETAVLEKNQKSASVTIRLSHAECAQLRKRAAAANLTVSAYMRSCIFEAETLRAQVKQALAELRAATPDESRRTAKPAPRRWWRPWPHAGSRSAQA
jgi:hypothetical protein